MFDNIRNNIDFFIRSNLKISRRNFVETNLENLERLEQENNYTFDILNKHFNKNVKNKIKTLDIGCKNWFYAKGQYKFFSQITNDFTMDGVELDAYRLYSNFYSRYEVAKFYTKDLKNVNYIAGNLLDLTDKYDYITWFLPFVHKTPLKLWGLPERYFCPEKLLYHAYNLLNTNGEMLIINQGEKERDIQKELLDKLKIPYTELGEVTSEFFTYKNKRYGFLCKKPLVKS